MQISLNSDQIRHLQTRFFKVTNNTAKSEYDKARWYHQLYTLVGREGFVSFLTRYFNYDATQIRSSEEQVNLFEKFSSRRLWMRVCGLRGIQRLASIDNTEKCDKVVELINSPKGSVNYSNVDLDRLIETGEIGSTNIIIFDTPQQTQKPTRNMRNLEKQMERLVATFNAGRDSRKKKSRGKSRSKRQPAMA